MPIVAIDVTTKNEWERPRELVRPWGSGVGSDVDCSDVTSGNGPAVTSRSCVLDPRKNETLDVVTSKIRLYYVVSLHSQRQIMQQNISAQCHRKEQRIVWRFLPLVLIKMETNTEQWWNDTDGEKPK